jgi:hypothetical protein
MPHFGRLGRQPARQSWPRGELYDFTPWLAENLDLLGEELGALELREREHLVGRYLLDLLFQDAQALVAVSPGLRGD